MSIPTFSLLEILEEVQDCVEVARQACTHIRRSSRWRDARPAAQLNDALLGRALELLRPSISKLGHMERKQEAETLATTRALMDAEETQQKQLHAIAQLRGAILEFKRRGGHDLYNILADAMGETVQFSNEEPEE